MSTNNTDAIKQIVDSVDSMIETKINSAGFDKTRWGEITAVNADGTYNVTVDGREYTSIKNINVNPTVGSVGTVIYPNNQPTNAFLLNVNARGQLPIGSLYEWSGYGITGAPDMSTPKKVAQVLGYGTWEAFGGGKVLVGSGTSDKTFTVGEANKGQSTLTLKAHTHTQETHSHLSCDYQSYNIITSGSGSKRTGPFGVGTHQGTIGTNGATPTINANTEIGDPNKGNLPCYEVIYRYRRIA